MTATDELRKLLDERGVDYEVKDLPDINFFHDTRWNANGVRWRFMEFVGATTFLMMCNEWKDCTPEQAIAATLGSERESELKDALNDVAEKWAIAHVQAEDSARRCKLLETLVRDWQELYENPDYGECLRLIDRMRILGIEVEQ